MARRKKGYRPYRPKGESIEHFEARMQIPSIRWGESAEQFEARVQAQMRGEALPPRARKATPPPMKPAKPPKTFLGVINDPYEYRHAIKRGEYTEAQVRAEYMRLRRILRGRLETFAKYEPDAAWAQRNQLTRYAPQSQLKKQGELLGALAYLRSQLYSRSSSVAGYRQQRQQDADWLELNYGIKLRTNQDWEEFSELMNYLRSFRKEHLKYSEKVLENIAEEGIHKIYEEWKAGRYDPMSDLEPAPERQSNRRNYGQGV